MTRTLEDHRTTEGFDCVRFGGHLPSSLAETTIADETVPHRVTHGGRQAIATPERSRIVKSHAPLAALVACLSPLAAQTVSVSLSAVTPLTAQVSDGTSTTQASWPAGPLPNYDGIAAYLPGGAPGVAGATWHAFAGDRAAVANFTNQIHNPTALPGFNGHTGPHEFLVEFASAAPVTANLRISRFTDLTPGAPWPTVQVDFDNDGIVDVADVSTVHGALLVPSFGPQPLLVRVIVNASLGAQTESFTLVSLTLTPENNLTITTPVAACFAYSPPPPAFLAASFAGRGIDLAIEQNPIEPSLMVLGFGAQPVLLSTNGSLPCILLPTPDILIFEPSGLRNLPLPPSVRPVTFFAQGVILSQTGLRTTDGFLVDAL